MAALKPPFSTALPSDPPARAEWVNGEFYLGKLAELGVDLIRTTPGTAEFFAGPLHIVQAGMGFTVSVVYRVVATTDRHLELEVVGLLDPAGRRRSLAPGVRLALDLIDPDPIYCNEVQSFRSRAVAAVNVPGIGCDIAGYVSAGEAAADAYLLAGDFVGVEAGLRLADVRAFEIATGLLSALLTKAHFQERADRDRLTGLSSSARIRTELEQCLQRRSREAAGPLTVVLADVDDFKRINDQHGHLQGDAVLEGLGRIIQAHLRPGQDRAGRYGGEEFLLLLENTGAEEARARLEALRVAVAEHPFRQMETSGAAKTGPELGVTLSMGACVLLPEEPRATAHDVLGRADRVLYAAKETGRNRIAGL
jgi:diguanylate cyclase (GGDEF)-like protein